MTTKRLKRQDSNLFFKKKKLTHCITQGCKNLHIERGIVLDQDQAGFGQTSLDNNIFDIAKHLIDVVLIRCARCVAVYSLSCANK